jgi:hypothetical protein
MEGWEDIKKDRGYKEKRRKEKNRRNYGRIKL